MKDTDKSIVWRSPNGDVFACVEKNNVLQEDLAEVRQIRQDARDDTILMGCDAMRMRAALVAKIASLVSRYPPDG